ncbi:MAG: AsmA family protein, partial [Rikenellaceae bacterium]
EADSLSGVEIGDYTLTVRRLKIDSTQIVIDDRSKQFYTRVENFRTNLSMNLSSHVSDLDVVAGFSNLIVWREGDLLVRKTSLELRSKMLYDKDSMKLSFDKARMILNGIDLKARGELRQDTTTSGVMVNIRAMLNTPSLSEFLALVPKSIIDSKDKITTEGEVTFKMDIKGIYCEKSMPSLGATLNINNAKAKYESRKLALESVNCDAYMFVDLNSPQNSYANIKSLQVNTSDIINLNFSGKVTNAIEDPRIDMAIKSTIDFNRFTEVFPLNEGVICSGESISDLNTQFTLSDVQNNKFADLYISGETEFKNLEISYDASKFTRDSSSVAYLYMQAETGRMLFGDNVKSDNNSRTLRAQVNFQGLGYRSKSGEYVEIQDIELKGGANFDRTTSEMNGVGVRGIAKNMKVGADSLFEATLQSSDVTLIAMPKNDKHEAKLKAKVISNQIIAREPTYNSTMELSTVDMNIDMERIEAKNWDTKGSVSFADYAMLSDLFPLDVKVPRTTVELSNRTVYLKNAEVSLGESQMVATGDIHNLLQKFFVNPRAKLSGKLSIKAPYINVGELTDASNRSIMMLEAEETGDTLATDSVSMLFLVPRRMEFDFDINVDKALLEDAVIENVVGNMTIDKGAMTLKKLSLGAIGAEVSGDVIYRNVDRSSANVMANISLSSVDIARIGELMPSVNSMFPMIESFEGVVDFDVKLNTNLDSLSMPVTSSLYSAMRFKGKDLVLMDSETFSELSKSLMFKNKERNMIDSLELYALVSESRVDILPFKMSIDRYTAVVGGSQTIDPKTFDVDYGYHISIMKSPLPFKAGVDVSGNLEDFKFKVTKAKLKKTDFDEQYKIYKEYRSTIDASSDALQADIDAKRAAAAEKRRIHRAEQKRLEEEAAAQESDITPQDTTSVSN